ncbi:15434_t:CDS:2, partial [Entrophospora sp. SA101]
QLPTRQLCKFATLSKTYNLEIKRIVIRRFYSTFSDPNKRLLVYLSRYDLLEMSQTNHVYDLAFKNVNQEKLFALFSMETTQPKGTIGPERHNLEGLKMRDGTLLKTKPMNNPVQHILGRGITSEEKDVRIYLYDADDLSDEKPFTRSFHVTNGKLITPTDSCPNSNGRWSSKLYSKNKIKSNSIAAAAEFVGKNETIYDIPCIHYMIDTLKSVSVKCEMLLVAWEEKRKDKSCSNGIKYILLNGGEKLIRSRKHCIIS